MRMVAVLISAIVLPFSVLAYTSADKYQENSEFCDALSDITLTTVLFRDRMDLDWMDLEAVTEAKKDVHRLVKAIRGDTVTDNELFDAHFNFGWRSNADSARDRAITAYEDCMKASD